MILSANSLFTNRLIIGSSKKASTCSPVYEPKSDVPCYTTVDSNQLP